MSRVLSTKIRDRRRDHIVEVATEVFFREGYAAATMQAVSQRLGGSKATLYAYFPGKEDLLEAIIRVQCDRLTAALAEAPSVGAIEDQLRHLGLAFMTVLVSEAGVRTLQLAIEASRVNPVLAWRFEDIGIRIVTGQLTAFLQEAHARGDLDAPDPVRAANLFVALMRGDLHFRRLLNLIPEPSPDAVGDEVERSIGLFLGAFSRRAAKS